MKSKKTFTYFHIFFYIFTVSCFNLHIPHGNNTHSINTYFLYFYIFILFTDNVNGNLNVCHRNERGGTSGRKLFYDITVSCCFFSSFSYLDLFIYIYICIYFYCNNFLLSKRWRLYFINISKQK